MNTPSTMTDQSPLRVTTYTITPETGGVRISGIVRNNALDPVQNITVRAELYDAGGGLVAQGATDRPIPIMSSGYAVPFTLRIAEVPETYTSVQLRFEWQWWRLDLEHVPHTELRVDFDAPPPQMPGFFFSPGTVVNASTNMPAAQVHLVGALMTQHGDVVSVAEAWPVPGQLEPGQSARFTFTFTDPRGPLSVVVYAEAIDAVEPDELQKLLVLKYMK